MSKKSLLVLLLTFVSALGFSQSKNNIGFQASSRYNFISVGTYLQKNIFTKSYLSAGFDIHKKLFQGKPEDEQHTSYDFLDLMVPIRYEARPSITNNGKNNLLLGIEYQFGYRVSNGKVNYPTKNNYGFYQEKGWINNHNILFGYVRYQEKINIGVTSILSLNYIINGPLRKPLTEDDNNFNFGIKLFVEVH